MNGELARTMDEFAASLPDILVFWGFVLAAFAGWCWVRKVVGELADTEREELSAVESGCECRYCARMVDGPICAGCGAPRRV